MIRSLPPRTISIRPAGPDAATRPAAGGLRYRPQPAILGLERPGKLAELCGKVRITVKGEPPQGVDKQKLENGVYEPLREANLMD